MSEVIPRPAKGAYLDVVQLPLLHSFKMRNFRVHASDIILDSIVLVPALVLFLVNTSALAYRMGIPTSGDEILTLRTFSSIIFGSSTYDSIKIV